VPNDYFLTKHPGPKNPRTWRRRPHVPSSFYHNVKEPIDKKVDTRPSLILLPEEQVTCFLTTRAAKQRLVRSGGVAYMAGL
jgi:hypothetical protein